MPLQEEHEAEQGGIEICTKKSCKRDNTYLEEELCYKPWRNYFSATKQEKQSLDSWLGSFHPLPPRMSRLVIRDTTLQDAQVI